jgi:hypothetical protein
MLHIGSNIPPPPPPPGQIKPIAPTPPTVMTPLRKEIHHYPQIKLKNFQWKKLDVREAEKTVWNMDDDDSTLEETLKAQGEFEKIDALFPAKINTFLERKLAQTNQKATVQNDAIKFLTKEKNRNISKVYQNRLKKQYKMTTNFCFCRYRYFSKNQTF